MTDLANLLVDLATPEAVIVSLVGAILWSLPLQDTRWRSWHNSIGLGLVTLCAAVSALVYWDAERVVRAAWEGAQGLGVSWLLCEVGTHVMTRVRRGAPVPDEIDVPDTRRTASRSDA